MRSENPSVEKRRVGTYLREGGKDSVARRFIFSEAHRYGKMLTNPAICSEYPSLKGKSYPPIARHIEKHGLFITNVHAKYYILLELDDFVFSAKTHLISQRYHQGGDLKPRVLVFVREEDKVTKYLSDVEKTQLALALLRERTEADKGTEKFVKAHKLNSVFDYTFDSDKRRWRAEESKIDPFDLISKGF